MNKNIASTIISDTVRVSSATIFYESWFGNYYQYETLVFSKDSRVEFQQEIHGTNHSDGCESLLEATKQYHTEKAKELTNLLKN